MASRKTVDVTADRAVGKDEWWTMFYSCPECGSQDLASWFKFCPECGVNLNWVSYSDADM